MIGFRFLFCSFKLILLIDKNNSLSLLYMNAFLGYVHIAALFSHLPKTFALYRIQKYFYYFQYGSIYYIKLIIFRQPLLRLSQDGLQTHTGLLQQLNIGIARTIIYPFFEPKPEKDPKRRNRIKERLVRLSIVSPPVFGLENGMCVSSLKGKLSLEHALHIRYPFMSTLRGCPTNNIYYPST